MIYLIPKEKKLKKIFLGRKNAGFILGGYRVEVVEEVEVVEVTSTSSTSSTPSTIYAPSTFQHINYTLNN